MFVHTDTDTDIDAEFYADADTRAKTDIHADTDTDIDVDTVPNRPPTSTDGRSAAGVDRDMDLAVAGVVDRDVARLPERAIEVETLLQAVTLLRRNGILTDAEYEAKHRRLAAQR